MTNENATINPAGRDTLYAITERYRAVLADLTELEQEVASAGGEIDDEQEARLDALYEALDELEPAHERKVENYAMVIADLEADQAEIDARAAAVAEHLERHRRRSKAVQATIDRLKERQLESLRALGKSRVDGENFNTRRQRNSAPRIEPMVEGQVPDECGRARVVWVTEPSEYNDMKAMLEQMGHLPPPASIELDYERAKAVVVNAILDTLHAEHVEQMGKEPDEVPRPEPKDIPAGTYTLEELGLVVYWGEHVVNW